MLHASIHLDSMKDVWSQADNYFYTFRSKINFLSLDSEAFLMDNVKFQSIDLGISSQGKTLTEDFHQSFKFIYSRYFLESKRFFLDHRLDYFPCRHIKIVSLKKKKNSMSVFAFWIFFITQKLFFFLKVINK